MKTFKNEMLRLSYTNKYGETMVLVMDRNTTIWVHHNDCNKDFEKLSNFDYILNEEEINIIDLFCEACEEKLKHLQIDFEKL